MKVSGWVLIHGIGLAAALPAAWGAPLPYGALDEDKPRKPVVKKEKPPAVPQASRNTEDSLPGAKSNPQPVAASLAVAGAASAYKVGQMLKDCDVCPELVVLPAGELMMGSPPSEEERGDNEGPQHRVKIDYGLAVGKYEVSQREWRAVMGSNPSKFKGDDLPVETVSWADAQAYIKKLNAQTRNKYGYRLLSEAEWEYAARAGTSTTFSTGQTISTAQANFDGTINYKGFGTDVNREKTMPVGTFAANAWGLYDMHGNVFEWVEDCWHDNYKGAPADGSAWVSNCSGVRRVQRGGAWFNIAVYQRSASRHKNSPDQRSGGYGFRLARTL